MLDSGSYDKIPVEVYKEIYSEARVKFDETKERSGILTNRSIRIILITPAISGWAASHFTGINTINWVPLFILGVLLIFCQWKAVSSLFQRKSPLKGTMPESIYDTAEDLTNPEYDSEKVFYYQQVNRYQKKINRVESENKRRYETFRLALISSFIIFIYCIVLYILSKSQVI